MMTFEARKINLFWALQTRIPRESRCASYSSKSRPSEINYNNPGPHPNYSEAVRLLKDFWQMFVHHILTILLLSFSWACNLHRIGSLVLIVHDFADVPLEAAKMAKYVKRQRLADATFAVFTICWLISRLGLYPYRVIYSTMFEAVKVIEMFAAYYIFNSLLTALQFLHIVWTWMIARIALQAISSNGVKDLRSDDESSSDSDESPGQLQNHMLQAGDHKRPKSRKAD
ncbi:hypothetical protein ISCGN_008594 [Ixodes scapularis]